VKDEADAGAGVAAVTSNASSPVLRARNLRSTKSRPLRSHNRQPILRSLQRQPLPLPPRCRTRSLSQLHRLR
jgi:hypothetical protein